MRLEVGTGPFRLILDSGSKRLVPQPINDERDRFHTNFNIMEKIGEGTFGVAYKVTSKTEPNVFRAIKKQKERYTGVRDRDMRR